MAMLTKNLTIVDDGGVYEISSNEEFRDLLESLETKYLENVETGRRVIGFLSLVDGASYTTANRNNNNTPIIISTDESSSDDQERSQDEEEYDDEEEDDDDELETQMAISEQDSDNLPKSRGKSGATAKNQVAIAKRNGVVPKAIVVRRASSCTTDVKRKARNSLGQKKQQHMERSLKKQLDIASKLVKSGNELAKQGKLVGAMNAYRKVLKIRLKVLGKHHPNVATAFSNLGSILYVQGKYEEATNMYGRALKIQLRIHTSSGSKCHPDVAQLCYNLGKSYQHQPTKEEDSRKAYEFALSIYLKTSGEDCGKVSEIRKSLTAL
ncbi:unnamed protein product [Cylindrotheca closterium]|uniref:Kinesin light chain n=1 Tax=Cylindrotheca closterium TaxID=2856 RepID=A0AAD2CGD3_9STRA|nr:unnamed protein product [Cylindrotheca closterium]